LATPSYADRVFLNVPFDKRYRALFDALVFAVHDCGFVARCALESDDASVVRLQKIYDIMADCKYGIYDLSRTTLDTRNRLPRFNMPLELGVFLGAKRFGAAQQRREVCLILDTEPYRYQKFCSDIAGQDIRAHSNEGPTAVTVVRDWLRTSRKSDRFHIAGGKRIVERYGQFRSDLPQMCTSAGLEHGALIFLDYRTLVASWLKENPW
jgi:hypothetical protein